MDELKTEEARRDVDMVGFGVEEIVYELKGDGSFAEVRRERIDPRHIRIVGGHWMIKSVDGALPDLVDMTLTNDYNKANTLPPKFVMVQKP